MFLTGLEEGLLPLVRNQQFEGEDSKAIEEERRLMYVGITRAMEKLYLTLTRYRMKYGRTDAAVPSRFLNEIPDRLIESSGGIPSPFAKDPVPFDMDSDEDSESTFKKKQTDPFDDFEKEIANEFSDEAPQFGKRAARERPARQIDPAVRHIVDKIFADDIVQDDPNSFEVGDRIEHEMFGPGTVDGVQGTGLNTKLRINFRRSGMKLLLLNMAASKLRKL